MLVEFFAEVACVVGGVAVSLAPAVRDGDEQMIVVYVCVYSKAVVPGGKQQCETFRQETLSHWQWAVR